MAKLLLTSDLSKEVKPKGTFFDLHETYELLNCSTVQHISLRDGKTLVIDEEGKFKDKPKFNKEATKLYWAAYFKGAELEKHLAGLELFRLQYAFNQELDVIVGDALVCEYNELER